MRRVCSDGAFKHPLKTLGTFGLVMLAAPTIGHGGATYEPARAYTNYDRAWNASLRAAQDTGIKVTTIDRSGRLILGSKDGIDVTITVRPQAVR